jgi:hypothetical protein
MAGSNLTMSTSSWMLTSDLLSSSRARWATRGKGGKVFRDFNTWGTRLMVSAAYSAIVLWPIILIQTLPVAISRNKVRAVVPPTFSLLISTLFLRKIFRKAA